MRKPPNTRHDIRLGPLHAVATVQTNRYGAWWDVVDTQSDGVRDICGLNAYLSELIADILFTDYDTPTPESVLNDVLSGMAADPPSLDELRCYLRERARLHLEEIEYAQWALAHLSGLVLAELAEDDHPVEALTAWHRAANGNPTHDPVELAVAIVSARR